MEKKELIDLLNGDLELEYAAAIQYYAFSAMLRGAQYVSVADFMREHGDEEIEHAKTIADYVDYLGGVPAISVSNVKMAQDDKGMLELSLDAERVAKARYTERITQAAALNEFALVERLYKIISEEHDHEYELVTAIG